MKGKPPFLEELKISYAENFETQLAIGLLTEINILGVVRNVSNVVIQVLENNRESVVKIIADDHKIKDELFNEQYFGHLENKNVVGLTAHNMFEIIYTSLQNKQADLITSMHLQEIFIHRIYDRLDKNKIEGLQFKKKDELVKKIFCDEIFRDRGREEINPKPTCVRTLGINRNIFFSKKAPRGAIHSPALYKFKPIQDSHYYTQTTNHSLPFASGPSGHAGSLLLLGALCQLDRYEINLYALACFSFLTCGGNHSFHEVMIVASRLGVPYEFGNYDISIPEVIKNASLPSDKTNNSK